MTHLAPKPGDVILDATLGSGGHAQAILKQIGKEGFLIGVDQDDEAITRAQKRLASQTNVCITKANFSLLDEVLHRTGIQRLNGVLFDLGVSREQLESSERGFSFLKGGPLDMRMDREIGETACSLINGLSEEKLRELFYRLGQEPKAKRITREIVARRERQPFLSTLELAELAKSCYSYRSFKIHPATRIFQALRMAVNRELECLETGLHKAISCVASGGRVVVISFHSLEDRIVKRTFRENEARGILKILTKKVVRPRSGEVSENPRCRSAKLRAAEKSGEEDEKNR